MSKNDFRLFPITSRPCQSAQLWVPDITYIRLEAEFVYVAVVIEAFSGRVIGWALDRRVENDLTVAALRLALELR